MRIVVIGAGPGGYPAAVRAAQLGAEVALVEKALLGGTCLHWGCIPTKALVASARALETARRLPEFGIACHAGPEADWPAILKRKNSIVSTQTQGLERLMKAHGVKVVQGSARLAGPGRVAVSGPGEDDPLLEADKVILATGSSPADLPGLERDGRYILNSDDMFSLSEVPRRLAVVGGGVIGCEFACIMNALGSQVTIIEALESLLPIPAVDREITKILTRELKKQGVASHTGMVVGSWERAGEELTLNLEASPFIDPLPKRPPKARQVVVDKVLVAVGRAMNTKGLGLEELGIKLNPKGGLDVDRRMSTGLADVFAVGDMLGPSRPMLAHMATAEGLAAAANALGASREVSYHAVPSAVFTNPEAAWVGLGQEQAAEQGIDAQAHSFAMRALGKSQAAGEIAGVCRLVCRPGGGKLLGAQIIGAGATEMIHECVLALEQGLSAGDLAAVIHAHPTMSESLGEAAHTALGSCVHAAPMKRR